MAQWVDLVVVVVVIHGKSGRTVRRTMGAVVIVDGDGVVYFRGSLLKLVRDLDLILCLYSF